MSLTVGQRLNEPNNFDALRFLAASLVMVSHAFPLSYGTNINLEPLMRASGNQLTLGTLAVEVFFILSGALITMSFARSKTLLQFTAHRILRLIPGLAGMLVLSNFVLGPALTTEPISEYFLDSRFYEHLGNIFLIRPRYALPGVFEQLPWPNAISGVIWTLKYEALFYGVTALLGLVGLLKRMPVMVLVGICLVGPFLLDSKEGALATSLDLFRFYGAGILLYLWRDRIALRSWAAMGCGVVLCGGVVFGGFEILFVVFGTYIVAYLGLSPSLPFQNFGRHGDLSYGIYIYGFPAQQLASYWLGASVSWATNLAIAFPLTLILAYVSWHVIEKPALAWKRIFSANAVRGDGMVDGWIEKLGEMSRLRPSEDA